MTKSRLISLVVLVLAVGGVALWLFHNRHEQLQEHLDKHAALPKIILPTAPDAVTRAAEAVPESEVPETDRNQLVRDSLKLERTVWLNGKQATVKVGEKDRITEDKSGTVVTYGSGDRVVRMLFLAGPNRPAAYLDSILEGRLKGFVKAIYSEVNLSTTFHTTTITGQHCLIVYYSGMDPKRPSKKGSCGFRSGRLDSRA